MTMYNDNNQMGINIYENIKYNQDLNNIKQEAKNQKNN